MIYSFWAGVQFCKQYSGSLSGGILVETPQCLRWNWIQKQSHQERILLEMEQTSLPPGIPENSPCVPHTITSPPITSTSTSKLIPESFSLLEHHSLLVICIFTSNSTSSTLYLFAVLSLHPHICFSSWSPLLGYLFYQWNHHPLTRPGSWCLPFPHFSHLILNICLWQWFATLATKQNHLERFLKHTQVWAPLPEILI